MKSLVAILVLILVCVGCSKKDADEVRLARFSIEIKRGPANQPSIRVLPKPESKIGLVNASVTALDGEADEILFEKQGYIGATDRWFQMYIYSSLGLGQLSEFLGEKAEEKDRAIIGSGLPLGIERAHRTVFDKFRDPYYRYLVAYARGVNKYLRETRDPENKDAHKQLLIARGITHDPNFVFPDWTPLRSIAIAHNMSFYLSSPLLEKISTGLLGEVYRGLNNWSEYLDLLDFSPIAPTTILKGTSRFPEEARIPKKTKSHAVAKVPKVLPAIKFQCPELGFPFPECGRPPSIGSNSWVTSKSFNGSKYTILSGDTHLAMTYPPVFIELALDSPNFHVQGMNFPGLPSILMGANRNMAYLFTNHNADDGDVYLEKLDPTGDFTMIAGKPVKIEHKFYTLNVRQENGTLMPKQLDLRIVPGHGPIFSDHIPELLKLIEIVVSLKILPAPAGHPKLALAYRWNGHGDDKTGEGTTEYPGVVDMSQAQTPDDLVRGKRQFKTGSQNTVYADRSGNIGYVTSGNFPTRPYLSDEQPPQAFVDGSVVSREWGPFRDTSDLEMRNPREGRIVTANNDPFGGGYKYRNPANYRSLYFGLGFRAQRITELLENNKGHLDLATMQKIQYDHRANLELAFIDLLRNSEILPLLSDKPMEMAKILLNWETSNGGQAERDRIEPVMVNEWIQVCLEEHFSPIKTMIGTFSAAGKVETDDLMNGLFQTTVTLKTLYPRMKQRATFHDAKDSAKGKAFFKKTIEMAAARLTQRGKWKATWGEVNRLTFDATLEGLFPRWFSLPVEKPGMVESIDISARNVVAPNFRANFLLAEGEPIQAYNVLPGGNWGPLEPKGIYEELFSWRDGKQRRMIEFVQ